MLDVCLLGTSGMMPLPRRALTAMMTRYNGSSLLVDCGEGTQVSIRDKGWSIHGIDTLCITHTHGDHVSGIPGLLLSMGNDERKEPLTIIGPKGIKKVIESLLVIAPGLPFYIEYIELSEEVQMIERQGYYIEAFKVRHTVPCYGYSQIIKRAGKFDVERAKQLDIPVRAWSILQSGQTVKVDNKTFTPDMVLGEERQGIKVTYCTDTRPLPIIAEKAKDADLFICEGMYGEDEMISKAKENRHMTFTEAARLAKESGAKETWLTHYSPSLFRPKEYMEKVQAICDTVFPGKDLKTKEINFLDE